MGVPRSIGEPNNDLLFSLSATRDKCALALLELDNLVEFDALGEDAREDAVARFEDCVRSLARPCDSIITLSDSKSALVLDELIDLNHLQLAALKLTRSFQAFEQNAENEKPLRIFAGLVYAARITEHGCSVTEVVSRAESALNDARKQGPEDAVCVTSMEAEAQVESHWEIGARLRQAMLAHHLYLDYQPKIDLSSGTLSGAEALVRWRDQGRVVPPDEYLPALPADLMWELTEYCVRRAIRDITDYGLDIPIALNFDPSTLTEPDLIGFLTREINLWGVPAEQLVMEITESSNLFDMAQTNGRLQELRNLGFRVSIDDFGTGYSNLTRLRDLPIDEIKLDRTFSGNILEHEDNQIFTRSVIELSKSLGLPIVAEGIEDAETLEQLLKWGCTHGQGFYLGAPVPVEEFIALLR